jgi:hypothetical protein
VFILTRNIILHVRSALDDNSACQLPSPFFKRRPSGKYYAINADDRLIPSASAGVYHPELLLHTAGTPQGGAAIWVASSCKVKFRQLLDDTKSSWAGK